MLCCSLSLLCPFLDLLHHLSHLHDANILLHSSIFINKGMVYKCMLSSLLPYLKLQQTFAPDQDSN